MLMSSGDNEAVLDYGPNDFRVRRAGQFVCCAVTGEAISLEELRYWSVSLQEPYANAVVATKRLLDQG